MNVAVVIDLSVIQPQSVLAGLAGVSEARISQLSADIPTGVPAMQWLHAYCHRLREQAAGRLGSEVGGLDLAQERAALAREQREGIAINNAVKRGQYAAVTLLSEVLAGASQAVAERFDHLPGQLRKACPDLPPAAVEQVMSTIATARNEWVRQTSALVVASITSPEDDPAAIEADLSDEQGAH